MQKASLKFGLFTSGFVLLLGLFLLLSHWQFDRAKLKAQLSESASLMLAQPPISYNPAVEIERWRKYEVIGEYEQERGLLLDHRIYQGTHGYEAVNRFILVGGNRVLVNRGFVYGGARRDTWPEVSIPLGQVSLTGYFREDEAGRFRLGQVDYLSKDPRHPLLDLAAYQTAYQLNLLPHVFHILAQTPSQLSVSNEGEPLARTLVIDYRAQRSTAYAWQWLLFALMLCGLYSWWLIRQVRSRR